MTETQTQQYLLALSLLADLISGVYELPAELVTRASRILRHREPVSTRMRCEPVTRD